MILTEGGGTHYPPHPAGQFAAVCIDVIDMGIVDTQWGSKPKVKLRFYAGQVHQMEDGPTEAWVDGYFTASLHEKANLRGFLEAWRGRAFTGEELRGFDTEQLIGVPCYLNVVHNHADNGRTYANIGSVMGLPSGSQAPAIPADYQRVKDRDEQPDTATNGSDNPLDDSMPF